MQQRRSPGEQLRAAEGDEDDERDRDPGGHRDRAEVDAALGGDAGGDRDEQQRQDVVDDRRPEDRAARAALGESTGSSLFIGAALVATSVGITSAVLIELGVLERRTSRTILGAAIVDDILALLLVAVAAGVAAEGGVDLGSIAVTAAIAVAFVGFVALGGTQLLARRPALLHTPRFSESPLLPAVIICLGLAAFASQIGLAAIIGAFLAGMIVAETRDQHPIETEIEPLYAFFPPFFFAFIGLEMSLAAFGELDTLLLLAGVTALAVVTKFAGAYLGALRMGRRDATFVGVGMVPRGEVGIIVAGIGNATGTIDGELFAIIVAMSVITTLIVPPILRRLATADPDRGAEPAPA